MTLVGQPRHTRDCRWNLPRRYPASPVPAQLELLPGRDLQFIRINGTVVGAGVGLALHAIALALA